MEDAAAAVIPTNGYRQLEFYSFCTISFVGKSWLLIRLPYREWPVNTFYTCSLLLFFYLYFRYRQALKAPALVILSLAAAVAVDILGNKFGFYGHRFGPLRDYDEFAHFTGSGFSAIAAFWLFRAGTRRMGYRLSSASLSFLSTTIAFTYCGWYEILELLDELLYGDFVRIHTWDDTPNDLFYDFIGVIAFVALTGAVMAWRERRRPDTRVDLKPVQFGKIFSSLPRDLVTFLIITVLFSACAWFEIFTMFDQLSSDRIHFVENRDCPMRLFWELGICVAIALIYSVISSIRRRRIAVAD